MKGIGRYIVFILLICLQGTILAQDRVLSFWLWKVRSINGYLSFEGFLRDKETLFANAKREKINTRNYLGEALLKTQNYLWHPNFLIFDLGFSYQPIYRKDRFLVFPVRTESHSIQQRSARATLFQKKPLSLSANYRFQKDFINRDLLINIESFRETVGFNLRFSNRFLPFNFRYSKSLWREKEIETNRVFSSKRNIFSAEINKSFFKKDQNNLSYSREFYNRIYANSISVQNTIQNLLLKNRVNFRLSKPSYFMSNIWAYRQRGDDNFDKLQSFQNLSLGLPKSFKFNVIYNYTFFDQRTLQYNQHRASARLIHQLFLSLWSQVGVDYFILKQTAYRENIPTLEASFNYQKKIPTGKLYLNYSYRKRYEKRIGEPINVRVLDEEITLSDDQTTLLKNPNVDLNSIVVTDITGTLIYQEFFDYIIIPRGNYVQIKRVPGGQIENGMTVYVDYVYAQTGSYQFTTIGRNYGARLEIFKNHLQLYYNIFEQDYENIKLQNNRILQYIQKYTYGGEIYSKVFTAGLEIEDFQSNIVPYFQRRYFVTIAGTFYRDFDLSLTANYRRLELLDANEIQKLADLTGKLNIRLSRTSNIRLSGSFQKNRGKGLDLDLAIAKAEFNIKYRQLIYSMGYEIYNQRFILQKTNFSGLFLKIKREF